MVKKWQSILLGGIFGLLGLTLVLGCSWWAMYVSCHDGGGDLIYSRNAIACKQNVSFVSYACYQACEQYLTDHPGMPVPGTVNVPNINWSYHNSTI